VSPNFAYNIAMNTEDDETTAVESGADGAPGPKPTPSPSTELLAVGRADRPAWKSGSGPGRWTTIGCGLAIVMLIAALFAGSSLLRRTVWTGFAGARQRVVANLPGDLAPGERMRLTRNMDRFVVQLETKKDPYPLMGEFQRMVRSALEDRRITADEVEDLNLFLEAHLPDGGRDVPFSMP
jgi:hypothetical protein